MTDTPKPEKADTDYIVLRLSGRTWELVNATTAANAGAAIKATYAKLDQNRDPAATAQPATFVAVPARSWNRVTVTPKVETTLVLNDAVALETLPKAEV